MLIRQLLSFTVLFVGLSYIQSVSTGCVFTSTGTTWAGCTQNGYIHRTEVCPGDGTSECTSDITNTTTEGHLYFCSEANACENLSGKGYYVKDENDAYICDGQAKCKKLAALGGTCDANSVGKLYNSGGVKICLSYDGTTAIDNDISAAGSIVIPHYTGSIFGTTSNQYALLTIDVTNNNKKSILKGNTAGFYYVKSATLTIEAGGTAVAEGFLINCNASGICTKVTNPEAGYYKTGNNKYVSCDASGCKYLADLSGVSDCPSVGQMKTGADLCLDVATGSPKTATFGTDSYLVSFDIQSLYASSIRGGQFGVLKATDKKITLDTTVSGSICADADLKVTSKSGSCAAGSTEYTCTSGVCTLNTALPSCTYATGSTGCTGVDVDTHCIDSDKKLYSSDADGPCTADDSASSYLVFKCTNKDTCTLLDDDGIDTLTGTESLLVYYADANKVLTQKKDGFFYINTTKKKLVYCPPENNGICYRILTEGHYINSGSNSNESDAATNPLFSVAANGDAALVEKKSGSGGSVTTETYYLDASSEAEKDSFKKLISCMDNQGTIVCSSITPSEGYYLNAAVNNLTGAIITCSGTPVKCKTVDGTNDFSYIDAGKEGNIISCASGACTTAPGSKMQGHAYRDGTVTSPATDVNVMITYDRSEGKFVSTALDLSSTAVYYISAVNPGVPIKCDTSGGCAVAALNAAFYEDATDSNYVITCRASEGCFSSIALTRCKSSTAANAANKCKYNNGSGDTDLAAGRFCLNDNDSKIFKSGDGSCQEQPVGTYLFKANGNFYEAITLDTSYTGNDSGLIYECTTGPVCQQLISSSVVVSDKYMYTCDRVGMCTKTTTVKPGHYLIGAASVVANKPYLTHSKLLQCDGNSLDVCEEISSFTENDNHIDAANIENIITCPTATSCYSSVHGGTASVSKYYVDADNKNNIITCNHAGCTSSPGSTLQGHAYISGTDPEKKTLITYNASGSPPGFVIGSAIVADSYFIDGMNPKNLISCTVSGGCFASAPAIPSGSVMLFKTDGVTAANTITCTSEGCISSKALTQCVKVLSGKCYTAYTDENDNTPLDTQYCIYSDGKIYESTNDQGTCTAKSDGTYKLKYSSGYSVDDLSSGNGLIYICESGKCSQIIQSNYIDDGVTPVLFTCDKDGTCTKATSINLGYYILGVTTISQTAPFHTYKKLLKCSGNNLDNCKEVESIPEGHFIDASLATPVNVITCVKSKYCSVRTGISSYNSAYIDASDPSTLSLIVHDGTNLVSIPGSMIEGHAYLDANDASSKSIITCSKYGCVSEDRIKNMTAGKKIYFIDGYSPKTGLISCEKNRGKCSKATLAEASNGLYPDGTDSTNARNILCVSGTGCIASKSIPECTSTAAACKYDNAGTETDLALNHFCFWKDASNYVKIYKAATASTCTTEDGTFLIKSDGTGVKLDASYDGSDSGVIFKCASNVCTPLVSTTYLGSSYFYQCDGNGQCSKMTTIKEGIYVEGAPTIDDKKPHLYGPVVKCTSNDIADCAAVSLSGTQYFIDVEKTLIKCDGTNCERVLTPSLGYYKNAGDTSVNKYIECTYGKCQAIPVPDSSMDCSSSSHIGQLTKDEKVCLKETKESSAPGTAGTYLVNYYTKSIFKYYVSKENYFGLVVVSTDSILFGDANVIATYQTEYCFDDDFKKATDPSSGACETGKSKYACNTDGVCVQCTAGEKCIAPDVKVKEIAVEEVTEDTNASSLRIECQVLTGENCEKTYYLVNKAENYALSEEEGALFYCDPENAKEVCSEIFDVGYYIVDKETIYSCKAGSNGLDCSRGELTDQDNTCATATVGKLFLNQSKLALCLNYDTAAYAIDLTPTTSGNYLIKKDSSNLFGIPGDRDYAIVSVKEKVITINADYTNNLKYVYASKDAKMKLLEKGDTCPKNGSALDETKILELDCVNSRCKTLS